MLLPLVIALGVGGLVWKATRKSKPKKKLARGFTIVGEGTERGIMLDDVPKAWRWAKAKAASVKDSETADHAMDRIEKALGFVPIGIMFPLLGDDEWSDLRKGAQMLTWGELKKHAAAYAKNVVGPKTAPDPDPSIPAATLKMPMQVEVIDAPEGYPVVRFVGHPDEEAVMVAVESLPVELSISLTGLGRQLTAGQLAAFSYSERVRWAADAAEPLGQTDLDTMFRVFRGSTDVAAIELELYYRVDKGTQSQGGSQRLRIFVAELPQQQPQQ